MPKNPWEYFVLVRRVWWTEKVPGPGFAVVGICTAIASPFIPGAKAAIATFIAACILLLVSAWSVLAAQYRVWRAERESYEAQCAETSAHQIKLEAERASHVADVEAEKARNGKPEIRGRVVGFCRTGTVGNGTFLNSIHCSTGVSLQIEATNLRPVTTNIVGISIDGSGLRIPATFEEAEVWRPQLPANPALHSNMPEIAYAIRADLAASAQLSIEGYHWDDLGGTLSLTGLKIELIDGLGGRHPIQVDDGESISV